MEYLIHTEKKFPRRIKTTLQNTTKLPFGDGIKKILEQFEKKKLKFDDEIKR